MRDYRYRSRCCGKAIRAGENSRTPHQTAHGVWESATTVHEGMAHENARCFVHGGKPNRKSPARHRELVPSAQCVSSHATITSATSATSTSVTCDRGIRVTRVPRQRGGRGCRGATTRSPCRAAGPARTPSGRPPPAPPGSPPWPAAQTAARIATARCRPTTSGTRSPGSHYRLRVQNPAD